MEAGLALEDADARRQVGLELGVSLARHGALAQAALRQRVGDRLQVVRAVGLALADGALDGEWLVHGLGLLISG